MGVDTVTVTFPRAEYDALVAATERLRGPLPHGPYGPNVSLRELDARSAAETLRNAAPGLSPAA